jgi:hypothetical protein
MCAKFFVPNIGLSLSDQGEVPSSVCEGYISSDIGEIAKPCADCRGRRGNGSQHPNEP